MPYHKTHALRQKSKFGRCDWNISYTTGLGFDIALHGRR